MRANPINLTDLTGMAITVSAQREPPDNRIGVPRVQIVQTAMWLSFLKALTGYNYAKGSFTYFRGIGRSMHYYNRLDGHLGEEEQRAALAESKNLHEFRLVMQRCMQTTQCRSRLKDALIAAHSAIPAHERMDMTQVAVGRFATGVGVCYLFTQVGLFPVGPALALSAVNGDVRHYMHQANPTVETVMGILRAIGTGGH